MALEITKWDSNPPVGGHLDEVGLELRREAEAALGKQAGVGKVVREIFRHAVSRHEPEHGFESPPEVVVLDHGLEDLVDLGRLVAQGQVSDVPPQEREKLCVRQNSLDLVDHLKNVGQLSSAKWSAVGSKPVHRM